MMLAVTHLVSFAAGMIAAGALVRHRIATRDTELPELLLENRNPRDLQPTYSPLCGEVRQ